MTRLVLLFVTIGAASAAPLPFPKPQGDSDLARFQGEWVCVLDMHNGMDTNSGDIRGVVSGKQVVFTTNGKVTSTWTFTLDPRKSPKEMDLRQVIEDPLAADRSLLAVYQVGRDTLTIAYVHKEKGRVRPSDLQARKSGEYLMQFKRR
jgi:uncharacterized protein (TIGR03067 family)